MIFNLHGSQPSQAIACQIRMIRIQLFGFDETLALRRGQLQRVQELVKVVGRYLSVQQVLEQIGAYGRQGSRSTRILQSIPSGVFQQYDRVDLLTTRRIGLTRRQVFDGHRKGTVDHAIVVRADIILGPQHLKVAMHLMADMVQFIGHAIGIVNFAKTQVLVQTGLPGLGCFLEYLMVGFEELLVVLKTLSLVMIRCFLHCLRHGGSKEGCQRQR